MKKFVSWLIDNYLSGWVVSRSDYDEVQSRSWTAAFQREQANRREAAAVKEMFDTIDNAYARSIPFAKFDSHEVGAQVISHYDYELRSFQYSIRVPEVRWASCTDLASFKRNFLERFADNAARAFGEHVRKELFKLE